MPDALDQPGVKRSHFRMILMCARRAAPSVKLQATSDKLDIAAGKL